MKIYDYECPQCGKFKQNTLVNEKEHIFCECGTLMIRLMCAPKILTTIIPTYPGSQRRKAGYQHKHINRPATKTQVGVGGGVTKGIINE